jgi:hypothetical protein
MLALLIATPLTLGSETINIGPTSLQSVTLTLSPPAGATQYRVKWTSLSADIGQGWENTGSTLCQFTTDLRYGYTIRDNGVQVYMERIYATALDLNLSAFDGTIDYQGSSGTGWFETKTKTGAYSGWISGVPATVVAGHRPDHSDPCGAYAAQITMNYSGTLLVEYQ